MLEAACRAADAVLLDRRFFLLDEKAYRSRAVELLVTTHLRLAVSRGQP
jgi:uncharacterized protein (DUF1778 family)